MAIIDTYTEELQGFHIYDVHLTGVNLDIPIATETTLITTSPLANRILLIKSYGGGGNGDCILNLYVDDIWKSEYRTSQTEKTAQMVFPEPLKVNFGSIVRLTCYHNNKFGRSFKVYLNGFEWPI